MLVGMILFGNIMKVLLKKEKKMLLVVRKNPALLSSLFLVLPGILMISVYMMECVNSLVTDKPPSKGRFCNFIALWSLTTVITSNGSSVVVAYATYKLINGKKATISMVVVGNFLSFSFGATISAIYLAKGKLGPFLNLYCCVRDDAYDAAVIVPLVAIFVVATLTQTFLHSRSYLNYRKHIGKLRTNTSVTSKEATIKKRGLQMIFIFYLSYSVIVMNGIIKLWSGTSSVWSHVFGAWMAKLEPTFHCFLLSEILQKVRKNHERPFSARVQFSSQRTHRPNFSSIEQLKMSRMPNTTSKRDGTTLDFFPKAFFMGPFNRVWRSAKVYADVSRRNTLKSAVEKNSQSNDFSLPPKLGVNCNPFAESESLASAIEDEEKYSLHS